MCSSALTLRPPASPRERPPPSSPRGDRRQRRLTPGAALVLAAAAIPAVAGGKDIFDRLVGHPASPTLDAYIAWSCTGRRTPRSAPRRPTWPVQTSRGPVLVWAAPAVGGGSCSGVEAAFGAREIKRLRLAGHTIADN